MGRENDINSAAELEKELKPDLTRSELFSFRGEPKREDWGWARWGKSWVSGRDWKDWYKGTGPFAPAKPR